MSEKSAEFVLIDNHFRGLTDQHGVVVGIGDDGAVICSDPSLQIVVATDTLLESVHFPSDTPAEQIATRALCVNLSDMAAMGAVPKWFTLALTLPVETATTDWLQGFSRGLAYIAEQHNIALIGGDTTAGPLTISITLLGEVPKGVSLQRSGAKPGDDIFVSGTLGDGAAALDGLTNKDKSTLSHNPRLFEHFYCPQPQIKLGQGLRDFASACIDISDGLVADLAHLCRASQVSADIVSRHLPVHRELKQLAEEQYLQWVLSGGDDYQLCFTLPQARRDAFDKWLSGQDFFVTSIGKIRPMNHNQPLVTLDNDVILDVMGGYDHFK